MGANTRFLLKLFILCITLIYASKQDCDNCTIYYTKCQLDECTCFSDYGGCLNQTNTCMSVVFPGDSYQMNCRSRGCEWCAPVPTNSANDDTIAYIGVILGIFILLMIRDC